ncbi:hypothetical protein J2W27_000032 [Variovorax boronicumulans]|uniref:hypothetical protein n=1 Tax=Variovorax boronicumulans TaxID=436515 RepID=UPI0027891559|nr:hypothetical protein [Variovorax boronicumulans]MDP9907939.1 hypothetical protein [Variovorax boronicumulans]
MTEEEKAAGLAIFRGAKSIERGLKRLHAGWFQPVGDPFAEFVADVRGDEWGVNVETLGGLEQTVASTDTDAIEKMGDEFPVAVMKLAYARLTMAVHLAFDKQYTTAWQHLGSAHHWHGQLEGREWGAWEFETWQKKETVSKLQAARHRENRSSETDAMNWYDANRHLYSSDDATAEAIAGKVVPMKFRTVRGWITEHKKKKK